MKEILQSAAACLLLSTLNAHLVTAFAQGTAFTYQGRLNDGANPANGDYDLRFAIYDALAAGTQQDPMLTNAATAISNGLFTVTLDFGNQFPGANRWLEVGVRTNGGSAFTTLTARQKMTAAPYAITASNLSGTLSAGQLSGNIGSANVAGTYANVLTLNNAANSFSGNGAGLTGLNAANLTGTVPDARLSANVALLAGSQTFIGAKSFSSPVSIANPGDLSFGAATRQMINVWSTNYGIGVQNGTLYSRSDGGFAWFNKGVHANNTFDPGLGGTNLMWLDSIGDLYANASITVDTVNANNGSYLPGLVFGYGSGETIASQRGTNGSNRYGLDFYTGFQPRLSIANNGNVGIGINAPATKLDVNGTIHASGGIMFPDGSIQTTAAVGTTSPTTASGYAPGTTVAFTLNGSPCSLAGPLTIRGAVTVNGHLLASPLGNATVFLQRVRPIGFSDWANGFANITRRVLLPSNPTNWFTLVVTVTQPGGASQSLTMSNLLFQEYALDGKDGQLLEVANLIALNSSSTPFSRNGAISSSTPSADIPGLSVLTNGTAMPGVTLASLPIQAHAAFDAANPNLVIGIVVKDMNTMTLRANFSAGAGLFSLFANRSNRPIAIQKSGVTLVGADESIGSEYRLLLADDGLPIEELDVAYSSLSAP